MNTAASQSDQSVAYQPEPEQIEQEARRLLTSLMHVECTSGRKWNLESCRENAPVTLEINHRKKQKNAVILAHSYVEPEIIYGVGRLAGEGCCSTGTAS